MADLGIGSDLDIYVPEGTEVCGHVRHEKPLASLFFREAAPPHAWQRQPFPTAAKSKQPQVDCSPIKSSSVTLTCGSHILDHAPTQRPNRLLGHRAAPVLSEGCEPLISRQDAPIRYLNEPSRHRPGTLPRERFSPLTPAVIGAVRITASSMRAGPNRPDLTQRADAGFSATANFRDCTYIGENGETLPIGLLNFQQTSYIIKQGNRATPLTFGHHY
jgi:hypothetical protein